MSTVQGGQGNIVTNGLVLNLDAANPRSYPQPYDGTTWQNLVAVSSSLTGSLTNGVGYTGLNGGALTFDGVDNTILFGTGNTFFPLPSFTIDLWFQSKGTVPVTGTRPGLFGFTYGISTTFPTSNTLQIYVTSGSISQYINYTHPTNFRDDGSWNNLVFQATPTNSYLYINGGLKESISSIWLGSTIYPTNSWNLGRNNNNSNYFFTGSIATHKLYNRALSASEVLQNFNATRARFGI
jgi:hypothetical protein